MDYDLAPQTLKIDYKRLAIEVARKIMPDIQETLTNTILASMQRLDETEQRLSLAEDNMATVLTQLKDLLTENCCVAKKLDDLGNRSRCTNLRIIGLPEQMCCRQLLSNIKCLVFRSVFKSWNIKGLLSPYKQSMVLRHLGK